MLRLILFLLLAIGLHAKQAVIVGSGITGLTAGILLKQQGWDVKIYEKRQGIEHIGGALSIWPNGSRVLFNLPCGSEIEALKGDLRFEQWADQNGNHLLTLDRALFEERLGRPIINVCRSELQHVLFKTFGEEDVVFGKECCDCTEDGRLRFKDGSELHADLVIGADGVHSKIRKALFPEAHTTYAGYIALVGIFKFPEGERAQNHLIWQSGRYFLDFSISGGREMIYMTRPLPKGELRNYRTREEQIGLFRGWSQEVDHVLDRLLASQDDPAYAQHYFINENVEMEPLSTWASGRVVLLGDAAHPMGSMFGLNCNLGLEDAFELSRARSLEEFEAIQIPKCKRFYNLELMKKRLIMEGSVEENERFQTFVKRATFLELFQPILEALDSSSTSPLSG